MTEYPKALYRNGDVHSGDYVIVADADAEVPEGYGVTQEPEKRKPGRPKKTSDPAP